MQSSKGQTKSKYMACVRQYSVSFAVVSRKVDPVAADKIA
jgi:hypothetical protein